MIELTQEELKQQFSEPIFGQIAETADALGLECYVVGGYVRDIFLQRPSKDIDVVVVGSGIAMAEAPGSTSAKTAPAASPAIIRLTRLIPVHISHIFFIVPSLSYKQAALRITARILTAPAPRCAPGPS